MPLSTRQTEAEVFLNVYPFAIKWYFSNARKWQNLQFFEKPVWLPSAAVALVTQHRCMHGQ